MQIDLTATQAVIGLVISLGSAVALLAAAVRFVFAPRIRQMVTEVVQQEFELREEANAKVAEAEKTAIETLATRIGVIEERMTQNEKAAAETQAAVERIEEATKRQTKTLDAIVEGIGEIKDGFIVQREKVQRAEKDIEELQKASRRRVR